jgi:hypothetical protein
LLIEEEAENIFFIEVHLDAFFGVSEVTGAAGGLMTG